MRAEDALAAANAGADAIGLIFYESAPRFIKLDKARSIIEALPPFVTPVGVFVDSDAKEIKHVAQELGLRVVQLNGKESPDAVFQLKPIRVLKAIRVDQTFSHQLQLWQTAVRLRQFENLIGVVLEPGKTNQPGGTGVPNDWQHISNEIRNGACENLPPFVAAGGLTPETVADVVRQIRPWAVDVSTGVEESRGIKSEKKMRDFIAAVRAADESLAG